MWPLVAAAWLDVFTLRGAVLGVQRATGLHPDDIETLIRRSLGPERGQSDVVRGTRGGSRNRPRAPKISRLQTRISL